MAGASYICSNVDPVSPGGHPPMKYIKYKNEQFEQLSNEVIGRSRRSLFFVIVIGPQKFFSLSQGYFKQGRVFFYILAETRRRQGNICTQWFLQLVCFIQV